LSPERRADSNKENNQKEKKRVTADSLKHMVKRSLCTGAGPATGKIHYLTTEDTESTEKRISFSISVLSVSSVVKAFCVLSIGTDFKIL